MKAFDKVLHFRLINKLKAHEVDGNVAKIYYISWLTVRRQRVVINGVSSSCGHFIIRVPQGSVLRPLLFLIYINDIDTDLFSKICKFANDTKIGRAVATEDEVQLLRDDLKNLAKGLLIDKCCLMQKNV